VLARACTCSERMENDRIRSFDKRIKNVSSGTSGSFRRENVALQVRVKFYNVFNRAEVADPTGTNLC
jgi:hypothetical protein